MAVDLAAAQPGEPAAERGLAGFWRRVAALIIDLWLVFAVWEAIDIVLSHFTNGQADDVSLGIGVALYLGYFTVMWGARGWTLGYMLLGLRLLGPGGAPVGYGRAFLRALLIQVSFWLCLVPVVVSLLTVAFAREKRGLHDMVVRTQVLRD